MYVRYTNTCDSKKRERKIAEKTFFLSSFVFVCLAFSRITLNWVFFLHISSSLWWLHLYLSCSTFFCSSCCCVYFVYPLFRYDCVWKKRRIEMEIKGKVSCNNFIFFFSSFTTIFRVYWSFSTLLWLKFLGLICVDIKKFLLKFLCGHVNQQILTRQWNCRSFLHCN